MAEITLKRTGEFMRLVFELLAAAPDGLPAKQVIQAAQHRLTLTPYELGEYPSGGQRFEKVVRFATIDCVKAGWMFKSQGVWQLTELGRTALVHHADPEDFYKAAKKRYQEWKSTQVDAEPETAEEPADPGSSKSATTLLEESQEKAWDEVSEHLHRMNPFDFQAMVGELLRAMKYHVSWIAPPGKDGGVDIVASHDPFGSRGPRIKVQVKRQVQPVGVEGVRSFLSVLGEDDVGLFISLGGFTKDAMETARQQERRRLTLINKIQLYELWRDHYGALSGSGRRYMPLRPVYFLAPED